MKSLNQAYINSLAKNLVDSIKEVKYKLDGIETNLTDIIKKSIEDDAQIYANFNSDISGNISEIRLIGLRDEVIATHDQNYVKAVGSPLVIAFLYKFEEKEDINNVRV